MQTLVAGRHYVYGPGDYPGAIYHCIGHTLDWKPILIDVRHQTKHVLESIEGWQECASPPSSSSPS